MILIAPQGTRVTVGDELAKTLKGLGWKPESAPEPAKRGPGRPKKSE